MLFYIEVLLAKPFRNWSKILNHTSLHVACTIFIIMAANNLNKLLRHDRKVVRDIYK